MSKRKTGELRRKQAEQKHHPRSHKQSKTYYIDESKTIDFNQVKPSRKSIDLLPQSINQEKYILSLMDDSKDIVVVSGPAGTGKTYLAMLAAIKALRNGECDKIILTRPAVAVDDEKHGFLPGDLNQKMEPWVKPLLDILREYYSMKEIMYMLNEQIVEITPLAYCRGRTFKYSWVILDEAQNCTISQMKMLLTRIGTNSKIVVTGDIDQSDRLLNNNGLAHLQEQLIKDKVPGVAMCEFTVKDVKRHRIIEHILKLYE